jgi:hypothetical protein
LIVHARIIRRDGVLLQARLEECEQRSSKVVGCQFSVLRQRLFTENSLLRTDYLLRQPASQREPNGTAGTHGLAGNKHW